MSRNSVQRFGKWENEDDVSYRDYFANATKFKGEKGIDPNNSQGDPKPIATLTPGEGTEGKLVKPASEHFNNGDPIVWPPYNPPARNRNMDQCSQTYSSPRSICTRRPSPGFEKIFLMKPDRGEAFVPKFGDWNENPKVHEDLANMLEKLGERRHASAVPAPQPPLVLSSTPKHAARSPYNRKQPAMNKKTCCFPWCYKTKH